jgi:hypothetical protein
MYAVNQAGKGHNTKSARAAAEISSIWKRRGIDCSVYCIEADRHGRIVTRKVEFRTIAQCAAALVAAKRDIELGK